MIAVLFIDMQNACFEDPTLSACGQSLTEACNELIGLSREYRQQILKIAGLRDALDAPA